MHRIGIIREITRRSGLKEDVTRNIVNSVIDEIIRTLQQGEPVKIHGFGRIYLRRRAGSVYRNSGIARGAWKIPDRVYPAFRASRDLYALIRASREKYEIDKGREWAPRNPNYKYY